MQFTLHFYLAFASAFTFIETALIISETPAFLTTYSHFKIKSPASTSVLVGFSNPLFNWVRQSRAQPKPPLSLSIDRISVVI